MIHACDVANHYVRLIQAGQYDEVGELWADDAVFYNPQGTILRGKLSIKAFYARFLRQIAPTVRAASLLEDASGKTCVLELETQMSRGADGAWKTDPQATYSLSAIDRLTINEAGKIQHMLVYVAPANRCSGVTP
jgi:hypothetical protein